MGEWKLGDDATDPALYPNLYPPHEQPRPALPPAPPPELTLKTTIHGLFGGKAVCRFTTEHQSVWPEGHRGVDRRRLSDITCHECLARLT